jgi:colicin import membrane protein
VRGTILASTIFHAVGVSLLFLMRPSHSVVIPGPDVIQVALIGEPAPPPAPQPVVKANDAVVPDEEQGVQIEKSRPKPKPEVKQQPKSPEPPRPSPPRDDPPPPASAKRLMLPYAPVAGGLSGQVAVDDANFEFAYYLQMVRAQIGRNWTPPQGASPGVRVEVYFRVSRSGGITALRIETGSGNEFFDQSAIRAVTITEQLPPLPLGYSGSDLGIHFGFEYTGP